MLEQGPYPFELRTHYPHMKPHDVHLWEKYIRANPGLYLSCDYDVPVGPTPAWLDDDLDSVEGKQGILYRKKIDVVAYTEDYIALIEVKPRAGSSALGQILGYDLLWHQDFPDTPRTVPMIITNECQPSYSDIFRKLRVQVCEVGLCEYCKNH